MRFLKLNKKALAFVALLTVVTVGMVAIFGLVDGSINKAGGATDSKNPDDHESYGNVVYFQNEEYVQNRDVETVLILGIDHDESGSREDKYQSDFIAVCVVDNAKGTYRVLHINRDTITDITLMNDVGQVTGKTRAQITLAHSYGTNDAVRCGNSVLAVENLLFGVKIDHYVSMTMDAVSILNDSVGGVTLEIKDDMTVIDPKLIKGETVTLNGKQALSYVQARGGLEDSTNLARMERQRQYIGAFFEQYKKKTESGESILSSALLNAASYIYSDLSLQQLSKLGDKVSQYHPVGEILTLPGVAEKVNNHITYEIDEEAVKEIVIDLFYVKKNK